MEQPQPGLPTGEGPQSTSGETRGRGGRKDPPLLHYRIVISFRRERAQKGSVQQETWP